MQSQSQFTLHLIGCNNHLRATVLTLTYEWSWAGSRAAAVRLLMPFSVWLISLACAITNLAWSLAAAGRLCTPINLFHIRTFWFRWISRRHWRMLVAACLHLQVYVALFARICIRQSYTFRLIHIARFSLTLSRNISIAKRRTANFPSPNCYRYKIAICKWWVGFSTSGPKALRSRARVALKFIWHSDHECLQRCPISARSRRLH